MLVASLELQSVECHCMTSITVVILVLDKNHSLSRLYQTIKKLCL